MLILLLLQVAAPAADPPLSPQAQLYVAGATLLTILGQTLIAHFKGKHRDRSTSRALTSIAKDVSEMRTEIRDLSAHVIGPDGRNGMRSDVSALKEDMDELKRRGHFTTPNETRRVDPRDVSSIDRRSAV